MLAAPGVPYRRCEWARARRPTIIPARMPRDRVSRSHALRLPPAQADPVDAKPAIEQACHAACTVPADKYEACKDRIAKKGTGNCEAWSFDYWKCIDACVRGSGARGGKQPACAGGATRRREAACGTRACGSPRTRFSDFTLPLSSTQRRRRPRSSPRCVDDRCERCCRGGHGPRSRGRLAAVMVAGAWRLPPSARAARGAEAPATRGRALGSYVTASGVRRSFRSAARRRERVPDVRWSYTREQLRQLTRQRLCEARDPTGGIPRGPRVEAPLTEAWRLRALDSS